jgi:hypothetical protein
VWAILTDWYYGKTLWSIPIWFKFFFHILRFFEHHVPSAWHWDYSNYASYNGKTLWNIPILFLL